MVDWARKCLSVLLFGSWHKLLLSFKKNNKMFQSISRSRMGFILQILKADVESSQPSFASISVPGSSNSE